MNFTVIIFYTILKNLNCVHCTIQYLVSFTQQCLNNKHILRISNTFIFYHQFCEPSKGILTLPPYEGIHYLQWSVTVQHNAWLQFLRVYLVDRFHSYTYQRCTHWHGQWNPAHNHSPINQNIQTIHQKTENNTFWRDVHASLCSLLLYMKQTWTAWG